MKMRFDIYICGNPHRVLYHFCNENARELQAAWKTLTQHTDNFAYVPILVEDWNAQLSPWAAPAVFGREGFAGNGPETLGWLREKCMPAIHKEYPCIQESCIGGYSLAGLFSLWAYYETGLFRGAASCSGSLWYPGWEEYAASHHGPAGSRVYLSLGDKEEHTRNQQMQKVGDSTRRQHLLLMEDPHVVKTTLNWHPGGHFHQPTERTLQGLAWLLEHE